MNVEFLIIKHHNEQGINWLTDKFLVTKAQHGTMTTEAFSNFTKNVSKKSTIIF